MSIIIYRKTINNYSFGIYEQQNSSKNLPSLAKGMQESVGGRKKYVKTNKTRRNQQIFNDFQILR